VYYQSLPEEIENYRDHTWRRTPELRIENAADAERFVENIGFCATMTDARRPGPSLYIAVCGRRDAFMPRNVQKDPESNLAWYLKDDVMRHGRIYYAKLVRGRSTFIAPRLIPQFNALWGIPRRKESEVLTPNAQAILKVLRKEWEMGTRDLRMESGVTERAQFSRAIDELQRGMKVIPSEVLYEPKFTYIWSLAEGRFPQELSVRVSRIEALSELAKTYLRGAGLTLLGELAKVTGLSRPEAGRGNHVLVDKGLAERPANGVYRWSGMVDCESAGD
jgi:hypothetical protein